MLRFTTWMLMCCGTLALAATGCGGHGYELAPVRGRVTCNGNPVPGGVIQFAPIGESGAEAGPVAGGEIDENGNFTLSTFGGNDGAIVGQHRIMFVRPSREDIRNAEEDIEELENDQRDEEAAEDAAEEREWLERAKKVVNLPCNAPAQPEVTVAPGDNDIEIELVRGEREDED